MNLGENMKMNLCGFV